MKRSIATLTATGLALAVALAPASGKPKAAAGGNAVTEVDVRVCLGVAGGGPQDQIAACTKLINSGKIHKGKESDFYASRAAAYYAGGQLELAENDFTTAINQEKRPQFFFQRALVLMALSKVDKARADFDQVITLTPDFAPAYLMRGLASYQDGNFKAALSDFNAAAQRRPMYYQAIFARGAAKLRLDDDSGTDDLKEARGMSGRVDEELQAMGVVP